MAPGVTPVAVASTEKLNVLVRFRVRRKGLYAIAGLEVDHPVGGGPCRSTMYGASMACAHVRCGDDVERAVIDRIESLAGFP